MEYNLLILGRHLFNFLLLLSMNAHADYVTYVIGQHEHGKLVKSYVGKVDQALVKKISVSSEITSIFELTMIEDKIQSGTTDDLISGKYQLNFCQAANRCKLSRVYLFWKDKNLWIKRDDDFYFIFSPLDIRENIEIANRWYSPFADGDRRSWQALAERVVSSVGDRRTSFRRIHQHAGTDFKGKFKELVYPVASGQVLFVSHRNVNGMVLIKHWLADGRVYYSKYVHVIDARVAPGDWVSPERPLARLLNSSEFSHSGFQYNHLHLEIRKNYQDYGMASSESRTREELEKYCLDPEVFLKEHLAR